MKTIVEYTDRKRPLNTYPRRIISPTRPGPCCASHMRQIGRPFEEGNRTYTYRRCRVCGFTVRHFEAPAVPETTWRALGTHSLVPEKP